VIQAFQTALIGAATTVSIIILIRGISLETGESILVCRTLRVTRDGRAVPA
jgi:hypothetical protein